ncbi:MTOR-associated protein MEAK7 [Bacillus rossius redtenbacheri]|uniref:MTOR-associated protein MEAK7 n=1 Tax=Bacillus rossius redtenbacheri TaxID=93214 RepID=UPI002FDCD7EE
MGSSASRQDDKKRNFLFTNEDQHLHNIFRSMCADKGNKCSEKCLKNFWEKQLDKDLLTLLVNYLSGGSNGTVSFDDFAKLYVYLTRGSCGEKADVIFSILKSNKDGGDVSSKDVIEYVHSVVSTFFKISEGEGGEALGSWARARCPRMDEETHRLACTWCRRLATESGPVGRDALEEWLRRAPEFCSVQAHVVLRLYRLGEEDRALLPRCEVPAALKGFPSVLDLSHVLFLNAALPSALQAEWRLLFSTALHGESFSKMVGHILGQGPTLLIVRDGGGHIFGGFASESWKISPNFLGDSSCFLFTVTPSMGVYETTGYNDHYQYLNIQQQTMPNGLGMGGQFKYFGLWLDAEFGHGHCSETCTTYKNCPMLSSDKHFAVGHAEVWALGPPPKPEGDDDDEEGGKKSVLDVDLGAKALLELVGRSQHSEGIRQLEAEED